MVRLAPAVVALADDVRGVELHVAVRRRPHGLPSSDDDEVADRRLGSPSTTSSRRASVAERRPFDDRADVVGARGRCAPARRALVVDLVARRVRMSSKSTDTTGPMPAPGAIATTGRRARAARSRRARSPPDGPTHTADGHRRVRERSTQRVDVDVDRAGAVELDDERASRRVARPRATTSSISAAFGGSSRPFDLHDVDAPLRLDVAHRRSAPRPRSRPATPRAPSTTSASSKRTRVRGGWHRRSRSMRGWRLRSSAPPPTSSSSRARAASGRPPSPPRSRSPRRAPGSSVLIVEVEGKSGLPDDVRRAAARLRRDRPRHPASGPASSRPTRRSSTTSRPTGCADLEAARRRRARSKSSRPRFPA